MAIDDAVPPNIYAAATSAYGLPIVVPGREPGTQMQRSRRGAPNAAFMAGVFGPGALGAGPGSIWRIDGRTGTPTLFANVTLDGVPNSDLLSVASRLIHYRGSPPTAGPDDPPLRLDGTERTVRPWNRRAGGCRPSPVAFDPAGGLICRTRLSTAVILRLGATPRRCEESSLSVQRGRLF